MISDKDLDSYNKEELFELFAITKEKKQEEVGDKGSLGSESKGEWRQEYWDFRNNRTDVV